MQPFDISSALDAHFPGNTLPYAPLDHLGVLKVHGTDAPSFLQGQLTNDVLGLEAGKARLAGYLTPTGRLLATFWVIRQDEAPEPEQPEEPVFWLVCARDISAAIAKRLSMYVLRAKARVEDLSSQRQVLGFVGTPGRAGTPLADSAEPPVVAALPDVTLTETTTDMLTTPVRRLLGPERQLLRSLLIVSPATLAGEGGKPRRLRMNDSDWLQLDVASGVPWISADTQERFIPQMLNLDLVDGVSFRKGCYPGQEVVARSEYRGKVKRRMFAGLCSGPLPRPGTDIIAYDGTVVGQVVCTASLSATPDEEVTALLDSDPSDPDSQLPITLVGRRYLMLFEARIEVIGAQPRTAGMIATSLRVGHAAIGLLQLPYALPA
ncbi:MAG: folate-binding protein [Lautropia sp.]|nr:folate-binding protein [Lautropia sp.]